MARVGRKRKVAVPLPFDKGTGNLDKHVLVVEEKTEEGGKRRRVVTQTVLDRYYRSGLLGSGELGERRWLAGNRFRRDVDLSGQRASLTADLSREVRSGRQDLSVTDMALFARERLKKTHKSVGALGWPILYHVCGQDLAASDFIRTSGYARGRQAEILGMGVLRMALDLLRRHYDPADVNAHVKG